MTVPTDLPWSKKYPATVDWQAEMPVSPLYTILDNAVRDFPDNQAADFMGRVYTYRDLGALVAKATKGLQALGVKKGDRVGLFLPNTPYYVILYYAILKAGGIVVNFNPLYADREIVKQINDSGCAVMATVDNPQLYEKLSKALETFCLKKIVIGRMEDVLPSVTSFVYRFAKRSDIAHFPQDSHHIDFRSLVDNDGKFTPIAIDPVEDVAVLQYTGGTTGVPKGAMLTHANLVANVTQSRMIFSKAEVGRERMLGVLPFFHVFAMTVIMNLAILLGGCIIMLPRFDLGQVVKTIHKKKPTLFPAVPTIYTAIINYKSLADYDLRSIKFCISGGAPLPIEAKRDFEKLTGCIVVEGYGLSETSPVTHCNPIDGENKTGSVGLPVPGTYVEISSLDDPAVEVPQGQRGEVCIRGPQVMKGYWRNDVETAHVLEQTPRGLRLRTGDVGYLDEDGYTYIVDRIKDMIAAGGFKIYPRMVEEAIYLHPAVEECIVAGVADTYRGQTVKAWIKLKAGQTLTPEAMKIFLKDKISPIAMPKQIEFRDNLPKTIIGKLSRKLILEEEGEGKQI